MGRSQSREQAFIFVFEKQFQSDLSYEDMKSFAAETELFEPDSFTELLYTQTFLHLEQVDDEIKKYLKKWRIERLPKVSLAILRLSVAEILFSKDVPPGVIVNEAVNLAKKYATKEDSSFINGVLGSLIRNQKAETSENKEESKPQTTTETE